MLTQEKVLEAVRNGRESGCLDGRDYNRLAGFFPESELGLLGLTKDGDDKWIQRSWTEEEVKKQLVEDVEFGFEKALNKRGISASFMYETVKMWMWILEDDLQNFEEYAQYGLPFLKAVAIKYNLPNPIGDDAGDESKYSSGGDY